MTPEQIIRRRFGRSIGGYRREEVHAFLADVALVVERARGKAEPNQDVAAALRALIERLDDAGPERDAPAPVASTRRPVPDGVGIDPRSGLPRAAGTDRQEPALHAVRSRRGVDADAVVAQVPEADGATRMVTIEVREGETSMIAAPDDVTTTVVDHDMYCVSVYRGARLIATGHLDGVDDATPADDDAHRTA